MCTHNYTHIHLVSWQDLLSMTSGYLRPPLQEPCSLQCTGDSALCKINMANIDSNKRVVTQALLGSSNSYTSSMGSGNTLPFHPFFICLCALMIQIRTLHEERIYRVSGGWFQSLFLFVLMAIWITSEDFDKALIITYRDDAQIQTESFILINVNPGPHFDHGYCFWGLSRFSAKHCHQVWILDFLLNRWEEKGPTCEVLLPVTPTGV